MDKKEEFLLSNLYINKVSITKLCINNLTEKVLCLLSRIPSVETVYIYWMNPGVVWSREVKTETTSEWKNSQVFG